MAVHHVADNDDFQNKLTEAGTKLVVVDFFATWCGPCKTIAPKLEDLAAEFSDSLVVLKVDVDECPEIAEKYNISSMPTFFMIKEGKSLENFSGANYQALRTCINKHM